MSNIDPSTWNPDWELNEQIEGIPLDADASISDSWKAFRILMAAIGTHGQTLIQKVSGPASSVDEHIVLFDGTSGLKLKDSGLSLSDITVNPFTGATASAAGTTGLVPQPLAGDQDKVLRGDGTWGAIVASDVPNIPASKITSGTIDLARLPAGALERLVTVANQTARFALTTASVQLGDTVKQLDTGIMYIVVDTSKLGQAAGYVEYTAGSAASVPWSGVTGKPSSYTPSSHTHGSITNDGKLGTASRVVVTDGSKVIGVSSITTTKLGYLTDVTANIQGQIDGKADKATTLAGYGITDAKIASGVITLGSNTITPLTSASSLNAAKLTGTASVNTTGKATTAGTADKVANKLTLKVKTGTTEGTDLYTFDGSGAKTLDIKQGSNITLTAVAGQLTIAGVGDTKNTAGSTDSSSKLFLIGATSQAANPQTYSHDTAYVGTDGCLYSGGTKVLTAHQDISGKADDSAVVHKTGNEGISGTKTFNSQIVGTICKSHTGYVDMLQTYQSDNGANRSCTIRCTNGDGFNEILIGAHDESNSAPAGLFITNTDGTLSGSFNGSLRLTRITDAQGTQDNSPALSIGSTSGTHLELDGNEIMAKASGTTVGPFYINAQGGDVYIGGNSENYKSVTGRGKGSSTVPVYTNADGIVTACGSSLDVGITGNAATATKLATARTINGVSFDGSANITVADSTKVAKAGDTMTGNLAIKKNGPVFSLINNQAEINVTTAQYDTRINFYDKNEHPLGSLLTRIYSDKSSYTYLRSFSFVSTNYGNVFADISVGFDKDGNVKTSAPNPSASSNTNEIATTKWVNDKGYVLKSGDTMTGGLIISRDSPYLFLKNTLVERGTAPNSYIATTEILGRDKNNNSNWALYHTYDTDKTHRISLLCYNGLTTDASYASISVGYDKNGNPFTHAPTPAEGDSTTKIATTYFVNQKCNNYLPLSGGTMSGILYEKPSNVNISVEPESYKEDWRFYITRSDADTVHNGLLMRLGATQASNTKDYRIVFGVANPRAGNLPTQESIAGGEDDSDARTSNNWGGIGVYYDYSKNRAYPYCYDLATCELTDDSTQRLATNYWVRHATGDFACNAATATSAASATKLFPQPNTSMPTGNLTEDGLQLVEVTLSNTGYPCYYGNVLNAQGSVKKGAGQLLLGWSGNTNGIEHLYYRNKRDNASTWSDWKTIAFTSDDITGNAATATKATQDKNGLQIDTGYLKLTGGTVTGNLSLNGNLFLNNRSLYRDCVHTRGIAADSDDNGWLCMSRDAAGNYCGGVSHIYYTDKTAKTRLVCYRGTTADSAWSALEIGYDSSGNVFTSAPTPSDYDASNKIATTAFVYRNAARHRLSDVTYYVSNASGASGDGSSAENAMSVQDMWLMLSTIHMQPTAGSCESGHVLTLRFVRTGTSYGTVRIEAAKMPGVRFLTVTNASGTDSTTSNWSTNSPEFANFYVNGSGIQVTLKNVYVSGTVFSEYHGRLTISGFVGAGRFVAYSYGRIDFADNTVVNVHNTGTDYLVQSYEFGYARVAGNTTTFNFREQCYFNGSIFRTDGCGRLSVDYTRLKFTGTQPVVAVNVSGTKTGHSSTAAGTAAKVVTLESGQTFSLAANAVAYVTFDNTNTAANPTLNINNTGAKAIWVNGATIPAKYLNKHIQYKFTYDGTRYICNNTFQRVEVAGQNSLFQTSGNYDQTYNSGSWNWSGFINWFGTGAVANGVVSGNVTGTSANVTGTVGIGHGGTGATTREDACKNLFQKNMGSSDIAFFLTGTSNFADSGYSSVADVKTILGLKSAAYTESSAYAAAGHTHSYLPLSGGTLTGTITSNVNNIIKRNVTDDILSLRGGTDVSNGARFELYGGTRSVNPGSFLLTASIDSSTYKQLLGKPDGTLTWGGQSIQTSSDERLKTPLSKVPDEVLDAWEAVELGQFKFLSAIDCKGDASRLHLGLIAQKVKAVFDDRGLDACEYGILCYEEDEDLWMVRYTEALAMEAVCQRRRADRLEARIAALEEATNA